MSSNKFTSPTEGPPEYQDLEFKRIITNYIKFKFNEGILNPSLNSKKIINDKMMSMKI